MSPFEWIRAVRECPIRNASDKAVLFVLASYSNPLGECFPSQTTIAAGAGLSPRRVRDALARLELARAIKVSKVPGRSALYTLTPDAVSATPDAPSHTPDNTSGPDAASYPPDNTSGVPRTLRPVTPDAPSYEESKKGPVEESKEETKKEAPALPWWSKAIKPRSHAKKLGTKRELVAGIQQVLTRWRGDDPEAIPARGPSEAVLKLWDAMRESYGDRVDLAKAIDRASLIAEACVGCPDEIFAKHVRGEGWEGKSDASRNHGAVFRVRAPHHSSGADWETRLQAAIAWDNAGRPKHAASERGHSKAYEEPEWEEEEPTQADLEALEWLEARGK